MAFLEGYARKLGVLEYKGTWDASTGNPPLTQQRGGYYIVSVAGTTLLDGISSWNPGDWVIYNGTEWEKIDNTDLVTSVSGRTGDIVLTKSDVGLENVDNTSDMDKPVSDAQRAAIDQTAYYFAIVL